jgi:hypothetical protein
MAPVDSLHAHPGDSALAEPDIDDVEMMSRRAKNLKQPPSPVVDDAIEDPQKEKKKTDDEKKEAKPPQ